MRGCLILEWVGVGVRGYGGGLGWLVIRFGHVSTTNRWKRATRWQKLLGAQQRDDVNPLTHWTTRYHIQPAVASLTSSPCLDTIIKAVTWNDPVASVVFLVNEKKKKLFMLQTCRSMQTILYHFIIQDWKAGVPNSVSARMFVKRSKTSEKLPLGFFHLPDLAKNNSHKE